MVIILLYDWGRGVCSDRYRTGRSGWRGIGREVGGDGDGPVWSQVGDVHGLNDKAVGP